MVAEQMAGEQPVELSGEEQTLQSAVRQNAAGSRRAAWRVTTSVEYEGETEGNDQVAAYVRECFVKGKAELPDIYDGILALMDENLIPSASTGEPKVFYYKTNGDYYRFLAQFATVDPKSKVAQEVVDMPVVLQRQVARIQRAQNTVEVPQVQYIGKTVHVPVVKQCQIPTIQAVRETVEVPHGQFLDPAVDVPVVMQRQAPQERIRERIANETDVPVPRVMGKSSKLRS